MATSADLDPAGMDAGAATVRLQCWGDFALTDAATGADLKPRGRKARALIAYLALHPAKPVSRERLAGLLWGDRAEPQARASLRQAVTELRALTNGRGLIAVDQDRLSLNPAALATDIQDMRTAVSAHEFAGLVERLPEPDDRLFANLDDVDSGFDDWLAIERARQREALVELIAGASASALAHGRTREARALHARLRELEPAAPPQRIADRAPPPLPANHAASAPPSLIERSQRWRVAILVALLLTFSVLAIAAWQFRGERPGGPVALAVLPFRDLSGAGNMHFAEGVSEEVLAQLARNPGLTLTGRTSAWSVGKQGLDAPETGRKLGVAYLVEGSVRSAGRRVRVDVALVRARDGAQLWSERLEGRLDDLFAMQDRIGNAVSARLARGMAPPVRTAAAARGDAYGLYLTARGLFHTRKMADMRTAIPLLRQAVKLDPDFAQGWALLGGVVAVEGAYAGRTPLAGGGEAERYVRHALALQPNLAEGHAMLGMVLGFMSPEARAHLKRAVQLDPRDPQTQFWLSNALWADGDYVGQLDALRRAVALDPAWHRTALTAGAAAWEMGFHEEGLRHVAPLPREEPFIACAIDYYMGRASGDYSRIAKTAAAARLALADAEASTNNLGFVALLLGEVAPARKLLEMPDAYWRLVLTGAPPDRATLRALNLESQTDERSVELLDLAVRQLLNADRGAEIVRLYDGREGSLAAAKPRSSAELLDLGPSIALALRQAGRDAEAAALLDRIDVSIRRSLRRGRVPNWYHAGMAQAWSVAGKREPALRELETAAAMGWNYVSWTPRSDIADLPAFRPLLGDPRFERIRARLKAHLARERREAGQITV